MTAAYTGELRAAVEAAEQAGRIQRENQTAIAGVELKADRSPVTEIDRRCERLIRDRLLAAFPHDGFTGEETGSIAGTSGRTWLVDPLDGTRPYIRGIPTYSVLIGLQEREEYVVGVTHFPALHETYRACKGGGAFCNNGRISVSQTAELSSAMGSCLGLAEKLDSREGKKLLSVLKRWDYTYGFMDAYSYMCVASGRLDACISLIDTPLDRASAACIITEAGGRFSDTAGAQTIHGNSLVLSNGLLHEPILALLR